MKRINIDNTELAEMYTAGATITSMMEHFRAGHNVIYQHLKQNPTTARRAPKKWSSEEDSQLVAARKSGCTGQEYVVRIPTRSLAAIKGHIRQLRLTN